MTTLSDQRAIDEFYRRQELDVIMDDEDAARQDLRKGALGMYAVWLRAVHLLRSYEGNQKMAFDCFFVAIGKGNEIGLESAVAISVHHFGDDSKKAAVTKCIKFFQDKVGIPPMPGQRADKGRGGMAEARTQQVKPR